MCRIRARVCETRCSSCFVVSHKPGNVETVFVLCMCHFSPTTTSRNTLKDRPGSCFPSKGRRRLGFGLQMLVEPGLLLPPEHAKHNTPTPCIHLPTSSDSVASPSRRTLFPNDRVRGGSCTTKPPSGDTTCTLEERHSRCTPLGPMRL